MLSARQAAASMLSMFDGKQAHEFAVKLCAAKIALDTGFDEGLKMFAQEVEDEDTRKAFKRVAVANAWPASTRAEKPYQGRKK